MSETPDISAVQISQRIREEFGINVSKSKVSEFRKKLGWKLGSTRYSQLIRNVNKERRKQWCELQLGNHETFDDVIFTDESRFEICNTSRRSYRKIGEPAPRHAKPKHPFSVMVWAGISKRGPTKLVVFSGIVDSTFYQETILNDALLPFIEDIFPDGHQFMQDNDPKHTFRSTEDFMVEKGINWWTTPPKSPDLNPIENLWHEAKHFLATVVKPHTKEQLLEGLNDFWNNRVTAEKCQKYIGHLETVIPKVIDGGAVQLDIDCIFIDLQKLMFSLFFFQVIFFKTGETLFETAVNGIFATNFLFISDTLCCE